MELLIGAGSSREKKLRLAKNKEWKDLVTLDINSECKPDVVHNLTDIPLPFEDSIFDEIHAYEVLEHTGQQGDWQFFFAQWGDFWRLLKPGGVFFGSSPAPSSPWVWGDPGHTRALSRETFVFLNQPEYEQIGTGSPMTDYRFVYTADFDFLCLDYQGHTFIYVLQAVKPSRIFQQK